MEEILIRKAVLGDEQNLLKLLKIHGDYKERLHGKQPSFLRQILSNEPRYGQIYIAVKNGKMIAVTHIKRGSFTCNPFAEENEEPLRCRMVAVLKEHRGKTELARKIVSFAKGMGAEIPKTSKAFGTHFIKAK